MAKDKSDLEISIDYAMSLSPKEISIYGGLSNQVDYLHSKLNDNSKTGQKRV